MTSARMEDWARFTPRQRLTRYGVLVATLLVVGWALGSIDVIWEWVWDAPAQMGDLFARMMPPDTSNLPSILEACGASRFKIVLYAIVPQVMPAFFAVAILRWDINLRESTVLGLVGAGGIGMILQGAIDTFNWPEVSMVLLTILALVIFGEVLSSFLRRRIL
mgnify:CR=1 FL=1